MRALKDGCTRARVYSCERSRREHLLSFLRVSPLHRMVRTTRERQSAQLSPGQLMRLSMPPRGYLCASVRAASWNVNCEIYYLLTIHNRNDCRHDYRFLITIAREITTLRRNVRFSERPLDKLLFASVLL